MLELLLTDIVINSGSLAELLHSWKLLERGQNQHRALYVYSVEGSLTGALDPINSD